MEDEIRDVIVAGGRAWVLLNGHGSKRNETVVMPIHPAVNGPVDTIAVPENARGMVIDQGILWVSADSSGHVYWFNPIALKMLGQIEVPQQKPTGPKPPPVPLIGSFAVGENGLWITGIGDTDTITVYDLTC